MATPAIFGLSLSHRSRRDALMSRFGDRPGILLDPGGIIVAANAPAAQLFGRTVEDLAGTPLSLLKPLLPEAEFDIVTNSNAVRLVRATAISEEGGLDCISVVLEEISNQEHRSLSELVLLALSDASELNPKCCLNVTLCLPPGIRAAAESREIVRDWIVMLGDLASSPDASLHLTGIQRDGWVELQLRLVEPHPAAEQQNSCSRVPDVAASNLFEMGGEFRVSSNYPETAVWLKLRAA